MKTFDRIIWAADPLEDGETKRQGLQILKDLSERTGAKVEPVYVLSDGLLSVSVPRTELVREFKAVSEKALQRYADDSHISNLEKPKVLVTGPSSKGKAADALDRYARSKKAALILVNSHGRRGLKRMMMGSFAETLALHAKTPVLITGPKSKTNRRLDPILFPTDFSKESKRAFNKVLDLALELKAGVTLFHVVVNALDPLMQSGTALLGGGYVSTRGLLSRDYEEQKVTAERWAEEARRKGVAIEVDFELDSTSVSLSILKAARKKKTGLIAMASESGAISATLLGSVGRVVGREAPCPVWFCRA